MTILRLVEKAILTRDGGRDGLVEGACEVISESCIRDHRGPCVWVFDESAVESTLRCMGASAGGVVVGAILFFLAER